MWKGYCLCVRWNDSPCLYMTISGQIKGHYITLQMWHYIFYEKVKVKLCIVTLPHVSYILFSGIAHFSRFYNYYSSYTWPFILCVCGQTYQNPHMMKAKMAYNRQCSFHKSCSKYNEEVIIEAIHFTWSNLINFVCTVRF